MKQQDGPPLANASRSQSIWQRFVALFDPHPSIRDPYLQFTLPKLTAFLLYAASMSLLAIPLSFSQYNQGWLPLQPLVDAVIFALLYRRARSRTPEWVAEITILFNTIIISFSVYLAPEVSFLVVPMLLIPLLLCTMFLSYRATIAVYVVSVLALLTLTQTYIDENLGHYVLTVTAYILVGVVVLLQSWYRLSYEAFRLQEFEASELRYRTLLSEAYDGILIVQKQKIRSIESKLARKLGYKEGELIGRSIVNILPDFNRRQIDDEQAFMAIGRNEETYHFEYIMVQDTSEQKYSTVIALRDVTEQRKTEEALAHAQRLDGLGILAGGIAHDFNNLLTGIKGQATIAQMKLPDDSPVQKSLVKLLASTERASDLTQQLLAYAGKGHFETKTLNFNEFASGLLKLLRSNLPTHIQMNTQLARQPLLITADPRQLQQILLNLVINGAQAIGDEKGRIEISTTFEHVLPQKAHQPLMWDQSSLPMGDYVRCTVTDSGCGMNAETLKRLFDPFFTTKETGTGLGLSATMGALKAHAGNLQVFSAVGEGTTFVIWLPLTIEELSAVRSRPPTIAHSTNNTLQTVLVIEDEQVVRDTICEMLGLAGYHVYSAENGHLGLECYEIHQDDIDLVLLDMQMPKMNGETTYYHLTAINPDVQVILMSGYSDLSTISRLTNERHLTIITKPFEHSTLLRTVEKASNQYELA
ncbi:MAG: ATP-binding protein [Candidatus Promineifilaceae bacterium]